MTGRNAFREWAVVCFLLLISSWPTSRSQEYQLSVLIWFMEGSLGTSSLHDQDKLNTDQTLDQGYLGILSSG